MFIWLRGISFMRKAIIIIIFLVAIAIVFLVSRKMATAPNNNAQNIEKLVVENNPAPNIISSNDYVVKNNPSEFVAPLNRVGERVTKKPFGIFITSQNSPVQPERFRDYHSGTDFEIFPEELNVDVSVKAVCAGKIKMKKYASGYGGVLVEDCILDNNLITVIYGHLKLASIQKNAGNNLAAGETIGILGADKSVETDGERKNLHLGFHKGTSVNILGYVQNKNELLDWLNPCDYGVCR